MTDQQRRELQARITNQRMEIRRLWAIEQVHWESVERWKATREGLEGKLRTAEAKLAEMEKHRDNMTELWAKEAAEKQVALGRAEAAEAERNNLSDKLELERALTDGAHRRAAAAETALAASEARVAKLVEALKVARAHVANNADGWSVSRGAARVDLTIVDAAITEAGQ